MVRAYDVMTRAVASVTPETPVAQVATTMRDSNIGDVLVIENGKLRGIVTDRDLAIHALTNGGNSQTPVKKYMTADVVTGQPDWTLDQVAQVMGDHQVRRLPIVQDGAVLGIVSLGDVALHSDKDKKVASSLKEISDSARVRFNRLSPVGKLIGIAIPIALTAGVLMFASSKQGQRVRRQFEETGIPNRARDTVNDLVAALQDPRTRRNAIQFLQNNGIVDRAGRLVDGGVQRLKDPETRESLAQLTDSARREVYALPHRVSQVRHEANDVSHKVNSIAHKNRLGF